jgi:hypothetical protein
MEAGATRKRKRKGNEEMLSSEAAMWRFVASVVVGVFAWFVLLVIHEEWRLPVNAAAFGPPPFNPFNPWTPAALIAAIWVLLNALIRWADRPEELPNATADVCERTNRGR